MDLISSSSLIVTGVGDVTYNSRRGLLGAISLNGKIAYHLYNIEFISAQKSGYSGKLLRKSKWHSQYGTSLGNLFIFPAIHLLLDNYISSFDFNHSGETAATLDCSGVCLLSDVGTNNCNYHLNVDRGKRSL